MASASYKFITAVFLAALITLFFTACAHKGTKAGCQELDWYEIGRQDGTNGQNENIRRDVAAVCESSDQSLSEALYNNGFDAGAAQYCTKKNGFELGQSSSPISDICPPLLKEVFLSSYSQGQRFTELSQLKNEVTQKLQTLEMALKDKSVEIARRGLINGEKIELQEKFKIIDSELEALGSSNKSNR